MKNTKIMKRKKKKKKKREKKKRKGKKKEKKTRKKHTVRRSRLMTNDSYALLAGRGTAGAAVARRQLTTN